MMRFRRGPVLLWLGIATTAAAQTRPEELPLAPASAGAARIRNALRANDLVQAQNAADELARREPESYESSFWTGYVAYRQGTFYSAIRALRKAEKLDSNSVVLKVLALSYLGAHQDRLFLLKMREAQQNQPADFAPYYYLGRYYDSEMADFGKAAGYFEQALARHAGHVASHYYLGHCLEEQQRPDHAEAEYRKAIALAEHQGMSDALSYEGLARLRLSANDSAGALAFAQRAVELAPGASSAHKLLGRVYSESGRPLDATREWESASAIDPTDTATLYRLYRTYKSLGDAGKARAALANYQRMAALYGTN